MNGYALVGRLTDLGVIKEGRNGKYCRTQIAITRPYKNSNGEYETDFITITLRKELAERLHEYCVKGDLVGVRGVFESTPKHKTILVANKLTFLATKQRVDDIEKQHENDDIPQF